MNKQRVLLIGWDAADWQIIHPLLESGGMPHLKRLMENGVSGNLATLRPILSPMLWNSVATGKRPYQHGIHGFSEVNEKTNTITPVMSTSRKVKAIWNMLNQHGLRSGVVNWYASHPAEPINGSIVTDFFLKTPKDWEAEWPLPPDSVRPAESLEELGKLRLHPTELEGELIQMFAPEIHELDQSKDRRPRMLATLIAEAVNTHTATTWMIENQEWDFLATYYASIDHFSHGFMTYHPPQLEIVKDHEFRIFKDVVPCCYRMHDLFLGRLLELAGDDVTVFLCSDHGFLSDHLRPIGTPKVPTGPAYWHRNQGIFVASGPGIAKGETLEGGSLLDMTPTILHHYGLPVGRDMDGRVLLEIFENPGELKTIGSWETLDGPHPDGMPDESADITAEESDAMLEQFIALGYIDKPDPDNDKALAQTRREARWNLAQAYLDGGQLEPAIEIFEELTYNNPERRDYVTTFASALQLMGMHEEAARITDMAIPEKDSETGLQVRAEMALAQGDLDKARDILTELEAVDADDRASGANVRAARYLTLAATYTRVRDWEAARANFKKSLEVDPDNVRAHLGVAKCELRLKNWEAAIEAALVATGLDFDLVQAHLVLGKALMRTGDYRHAVEALNVVVHKTFGQPRILALLARAHSHIPGHEAQVEALRKQAHLARESRELIQPKPDNFLAKLGERVRSRMDDLESAYERIRIDEAAEAAKYKEDGALKSLDEEPLIIVSGLPRSGTSLMMQMLQLGGIEPMTDGERAADEDNPEGYLEWEEIKQLKNHPELIDQAVGKATKVISMLLKDLPPHRHYKIIFMRRRVDEIAKSQAKMIDRRGTTGAEFSEGELARNLLKHRREVLQTLNVMPTIDVMTIAYHRLLDDPDRVVKRLKKFLPNRIPEPDKMSGAIRKDLYRNRAAPTTPA